MRQVYSEGRTGDTTPPPGIMKKDRTSQLQLTSISNSKNFKGFSCRLITSSEGWNTDWLMALGLKVFVSLWWQPFIKIQTCLYKFCIKASEFHLSLFILSVMPMHSKG